MTSVLLLSQRVDNVFPHRFSARNINIALLNFAVLKAEDCRLLVPKTILAAGFQLQENLKMQTSVFPSLETEGCAWKYAVATSKWFGLFGILEYTVDFRGTFKHETLVAAEVCIERAWSRSGVASREILKNIEESHAAWLAGDFDIIEAFGGGIRRISSEVFLLGMQTTLGLHSELKKKKLNPHLR